jgi:hypothetical protein
VRRSRARGAATAALLYVVALLALVLSLIAQRR